MLWTKRTHKSTIFQTLHALMKVHPIPQAIFEIKRSGFIQILHLCPVSWKITPVYFFSSDLIYFGQIEPTEVKFYRLLSGWVKIHQISHVLFETESQFFFKFSALFNVMGGHSSVNFSWNIKSFWKKEPIKL